MQWPPEETGKKTIRLPTSNEDSTKLVDPESESFYHIEKYNLKLIDVDRERFQYIEFLEKFTLKQLQDLQQRLDLPPNKQNTQYDYQLQCWQE